MVSEAPRPSIVQFSSSVMSALVGLKSSMNSSVAPPNPRERIWLMTTWARVQEAPLLLLVLLLLLLDAVVLALLPLLDVAELLLLEEAVEVDFAAEVLLLLDAPPAPPVVNWNVGYPQPAATAMDAAIIAVNRERLFMFPRAYIERAPSGRWSAAVDVGPQSAARGAGGGGSQMGGGLCPQ
jgi:hypothetical protein